jgi:hypothetical protein
MATVMTKAGISLRMSVADIVLSLSRESIPMA